MSDHLDEILRDADISLLQSEFGHLDDPMLVEALYQYLEARRGGRPRLKKARAYIKHVTTSLDPAKIWKRLRLPMPPPEDEPASRTTPPRRRRAGRPAWTAELFWARYRDACARATPPLTYQAVAPHFMTLDGTIGTSPEYLRKLVRRFGLPAE